MADLSDTDVLEALLDREPIFHRRHHGTSKDALEAIMAPDFFEVGASGHVYTRSDVIRICLERYKTPENFVGFATAANLRRLDRDLWQLFYTLVESGRTSRRSTLWRHVNDGWRIEYHQGPSVT